MLLVPWQVGLAVLFQPEVRNIVDDYLSVGARAYWIQAVPFGCMRDTRDTAFVH